MCYPLKIKTIIIIKLPVVIKTVVLSIFEWPFYTGFTAVANLLPADN